jgi:hypothetical protein
MLASIFQLHLKISYSYLKLQQKSVHRFHFASTVKEKYIAALANNLGQKDWIATYKITRMLAGLQS